MFGVGAYTLTKNTACEVYNILSQVASENVGIVSCITHESNKESDAHKVKKWKLLLSYLRVQQSLSRAIVA